MRSTVVYSHSLFSPWPVKMDKFVYIRGCLGPAEPSGKDAFNLYVWCPDALQQLYQETESCAYFFNTAEDGVITPEGKPTELKDIYGKK